MRASSTTIGQKRRLLMHLTCFQLFIIAVFFLFNASGCFAVEDHQKKPEDWEQRVEMLRSVPYLALSPTTVQESDTGVVLYDRERTWGGYQLACRLSAGEAFLMDMDGRKVHRWRYLPGAMSGEDHAIMLDNGDLVVIKKFTELARYDWNSDLIWKRELEAHHDLAQAPDGSLYVIAKESKSYRGLKVNFDILIHLTPDGEEIDRWSTYDRHDQIKRALGVEPLLDQMLRRFRGRISGATGEISPADGSQADEPDKIQGIFDYFHMNTVTVLPHNALSEKDSRFQQGNLLVCFRNTSQIVILEKDTYRLLWTWGQGELQWPHHPTMLPDGHILVFDNGVQRKYSRVIEVAPQEETIVWQYISQPPEDFYSPTRGSAQRLPNGNTLICESDNGRVFEVTEEGELIWLWLNPVIIGGHRETVYRMARLEPALVDPLLDRWWWWQ